MNQRGFTLVEILIVVLIISLASAFVIPRLSGGHQERKLEEEVKRFVSIVKLAQEEAIFSSAEYGLLVEPDNYQFYLLRERQWVKADRDALLRTRHIAEPIQLELEVEDQESFFTHTDKKEKDKKKRITPQILMLSSGELTPFEITFYIPGTDHETRVEGLITGEVKVGAHVN